MAGIALILQNQFWWGGGASQEACAQIAEDTTLPNLAVVTFGPIQAFLGAGQRLRDWAVASWLCHYLTAVLIYHWGGQRRQSAAAPPSTLQPGAVAQGRHPRRRHLLAGRTAERGHGPVTRMNPEWLNKAEGTIQNEWSRFVQATEPAAVEFCA